MTPGPAHTKGTEMLIVQADKMEAAEASLKKNADISKLFRK